MLNPKTGLKMASGAINIDNSKIKINNAQLSNKKTNLGSAH